MKKKLVILMAAVLAVFVIVTITVCTAEQKSCEETIRQADAFIQMVEGSR